MTEEIVEIPEEKEENNEGNNDQRKVAIIAIVFVLLILGGVVAAVLGLLNENTPTERIRDIFIIFMAFESLVIGVALVILILQIASLMNLLQNEIKPILDATNETVHTLRGTTAFLSENMVDPVIKLNANLAGLQRIFEILGIKKN
ncbi:MAG: hypothetical protein HN736_11800 [Anaerolineae bacterium]|jgi:hypothetical protein|nr:hypothetical protein [Anaerolineae bacterium]MBT4311998.1 hypothetical protein [Anaerolineae bacterium]MBT4458146.1 hypothetical protein [Anaerolineae bacterium]MBT4841901.1 hypothetical protein [Anaerolineae bacterium]MBT6059585.1 hypothetical protein [Anaerolineae bacterium]